jgi:hypothetical protein
VAKYLKFGHKTIGNEEEMWKNIGKSFKRVFEKVFRNSEIKNKNENESIEADIVEEP